MKYFFKSQKLRVIDTYVFENQAWDKALNAVINYVAPLDVHELSIQLQESCRSMWKISVIEGESEIMIPSALLHVMMYYYVRSVEDKTVLQKMMGSLYDELLKPVNVHNMLDNHMYRILHPRYVHTLSSIKTHRPHSSMLLLDQYLIDKDNMAILPKSPSKNGDIDSEYSHNNQKRSSYNNQAQEELSVDFTMNNYEM